MMYNKLGIYKITSPSGRVYIGQSSNVGYRWECYRKGYSKKQPKLHASFKKYGVSAHVFELVHELPIDVDQLTLDRYEQIYIDAYRDCGIDMLNLREAGCTGRHSEESKQKMKGKLGKWMIGRKIPRESVDKTTAKITGIKRSEESKLKYSLSKMRDKNPFYGKPAWNKGVKGFLKGSKAGSLHPAAKLTEEEVKAARIKYEHGRTVAELAREYSIGWGGMYSIITRKNWKHI